MCSDVVRFPCAFLFDFTSLIVVGHHSVLYLYGFHAMFVWGPVLTTIASFIPFVFVN